MRAGIVLEALAGTHCVTLMVVPLYPSFDREVPEPLRVLCEDSAVVTGKGASEIYSGREFDIVHVFRLASIAAAQPYLDAPSRPFRTLDLDDLESKTHRRLAALARSNGDTAFAAREDAEARRNELLEVVACRRFDRVYVCSEADRRELLTRCSAEISVLPNAVRAPELISAPAAAPFRLVFLGTLGYYPNADAVAWFCECVLPHLRRTAPAPFEITIAGSGASERLGSLAAAAGFDLRGPVAEVAPLYQSAGAVVVPIRAGGGTRIKILEAFSYRQPVVTTSIGLEGIDAQPGEHVLLGDTPEEFAAACVSLMRDPALSARLVQAAWLRWRQSYSLEALRTSVSSLAASRVPR